MNEQDKKDFSRAESAIYKLLSDCGWHTATEIIETSGQREGLRRLRNLRTRFEIQTRRVGASRDFEYRMVPQTQHQMVLF